MHINSLTVLILHTMARVIPGSIVQTSKQFSNMCELFRFPAFSTNVWGKKGKKKEKKRKEKKEL